MEIRTSRLMFKQGSPLISPVPYSDYFLREGKPTTAQYYVNPAGASVVTACQLGTPGSNEGNFAPVIIGAAKDPGSTTFLSLIPNTATSDGRLDFNISITGAVFSDCKYGGLFFDNGVLFPNGCTVSKNPFLWF